MNITRILVFMFISIVFVFETGASDFDPGKKLYQQYCQRCHGRELKNSGVSSFDLRRFPADEKERFSLSVLEGFNAMPPHEDVLTVAEVDEIFHYVITEQKTMVQQ